MFRREFLTLLTTGAVFAHPALARFVDHAEHFNTRTPYIFQPADVFTKQDLRLLAWIGETIIPADAYPGAIEAKVHHFIALIYRDWMQAAERAEFRQGLHDIDAASHTQYGKDFLSCTAEQRTDILQELEKEQLAQGNIEIGFASSFAMDTPFFPRLKELVATGFFMSETGGTRVLRSNPFPGFFEADIPLGEDESEWDYVPFM